MNLPQPPMVAMPAAACVLLVLAALLVLWSLIRRRKPPPRHEVVSWRVLWWRAWAPPDAVRRQLAPLEAQLREFDRLNELFPDHCDTPEGDSAVLAERP